MIVPVSTAARLRIDIRLKNSFALLLLPGFDGTGVLFHPLQSILDKTIATRICRYTTEESFDKGDNLRL